MMRNIKNYNIFNESSGNMFLQLLLDSVYLFKVKDFSTTLIGRYDNIKDCYYIQRGDGLKYEYTSDRIVWSKKLKCEIVINENDPYGEEIW
jgi:hypothetical protein